MRAVAAVLALALACTGDGGKRTDPTPLLRGAADAARTAPGATFTFTFETESPAGQTTLRGEGRVDFAADTSALELSFGEYAEANDLPGTIAAFTHGTTYWLAVPPDRRAGGRRWAATTVTEASIAMSTFMHPPYALDLLRLAYDVEEAESQAPGTRRLFASLEVGDIHTVVPEPMREATRNLFAKDPTVVRLDVVLDGQGRPVTIAGRHFQGRMSRFELSYGPVQPVVPPADADTTRVANVGALVRAAGFPS